MKLKKTILPQNIAPQKNISSDANQPEKATSVERIISEETPFDVIEAYKATRTNIMFSLSNEKGCKKIVLSSATSGEGKTTTCINLAKTFAEVGAKVLVLDADLRAPRVHKYLEYENEKGLSNILAGFDSLEDCVIHTAQANLDCITSGAIPPNPVELISSEAMTELMAELETRYDYIFIDTPPLNIVTEGLLLSKIASGIIIVTRQKYTLYKLVDRALSALKFADARILGFILNDADNDKFMYGVYRRGKRNTRYNRYNYYSYGGHAYAHADEKRREEAKKEANKQ